MKNLSILGSTGSIGKSTLDVVARHPDRFRVVALAEGHDVDEMARQIEKFRPKLASVRDSQSAERLKGIVRGRDVRIVHGIDGACEAASFDEADTVVSAIVGAAGLRPTMAAIEAGHTVALANKETMVVAGEFVSKAAAAEGTTILPVDSEHSAIFQSIEGHRREDISRIILTASGGPFLRKTKAEIDAASPEAALKHPRWSMGAKITIDSATLMNKGLEVIEARWLFGIEADRIDVVVHPQSIVHSMVEYRDGCVMAELGVPDMRAPIAYAISYPERVESGVQKLDLVNIKDLSFEAPDFDRFPCLRFAFDALSAGRSMPAVLNAANEVAVEAFLSCRIPFGEIPRIIRKTMDAHDPVHWKTLDEIIEIDAWARKKSREFIR